MEVMTVLTAILPLILLVALVALPLAWRIRADRRRDRADLLSADIRSAINRRLRGESLLSVEVTPETLWRPGRVVLLWRDVVDRLPVGYDLVVRPGHAAEPAPLRRAA
ncbi:MAG: hypothetical protein DME05_13210 [Candidatus Rokuibacteriota bacterium]|nr:MAG: hypothetical protein DME05_13210 [Candidatus Rokubacteria bacterium]